MANDNVVVEQQVAPTAPAIPAEVAAILNERLGMTPAAPAAATIPDVPHGTPPVNTPDTPASPAQPEAPNAPAFDFKVFSETFGYKSPEEALADIKDLRAFKEKPPVVTPTFENEHSKQVYELLAAGKQKEVAAFLSQQEKIDNLLSQELNEKNVDDFLRFGWSLKYKDLSPDLINHKLNRQFSVPKEPVREMDEDETDFAERKSQWEEQRKAVLMDKMLEVNILKPEIASAKASLVLPSIEKPADPMYQVFQDWIKEEENYKREALEAENVYRNFAAADAQIKLSYVDEKNKFNVDFDFVPSAEAVETAKKYLTDFDSWTKSYDNPDGSRDRKRFFRDMVRSIDFDRILSAAIAQARTSYIAGSLPNNAQAGADRGTVILPELSEVDKMMQQRGITR